MVRQKNLPYPQIIRYNKKGEDITDKPRIIPEGHAYYDLIYRINRDHGLV